MSLNKYQQNWILQFAKRAINDTLLPDPYAISKGTQLFLEELCELTEDVCKAFNEILGPANTHLTCNSFRLGHPRPGIMVLKGKEKLVVSAEPGKIKVKRVQVQAYNDQFVSSQEFTAKISAHQDLEWHSADNPGQPQAKVSPELVLRYFLSEFFTESFHGTKPLDQAKSKGNLPSNASASELRN
jgi:hypothetical protein